MLPRDIASVVDSKSEISRSDIGTLPGGLHSVGNAINNLRHITGTASLPNGHFLAFIWIKDLGMRKIGEIADGTYTAGQAINKSDEVVGFGGSGPTPFYWTQATRIIPLGTLGGTAGYAFSINDGGMIAGYTSINTGAIHATLWNNYTSSPQDLGTLNGGANSYGRSINNLGQIAGYADVP